jgi:hypothetical protein
MPWVSLPTKNISIWNQFKDSLEVMFILKIYDFFENFELRNVYEHQNMSKC